MRQDFRIYTRLAITSAFSVALCATLGLGRAQAQDKMSRDGARKDKMQTSRMMDDRDRMSDSDYDEDGIPVAPAYPKAAPGSLDLNYWTDYTRKHMRPGSATDAMMDKQKDKMASNSRSMESMEDAEDLIPVTPSYAEVSPGTLDLNHWTDFTAKHMHPGSATDAKMDKMHDKDRANMTNMTAEEEEEDLLPTTPRYPFAAPGTIDLNHWTDMTREHMAPGSASDAMKEKRDKKHDRMRKP